jgi:tetratricopeptide (TPR) repeat protein
MYREATVDLQGFGSKSFVFASDAASGEACIARETFRTYLTFQVPLRRWRRYASAFLVAALTSSFALAAPAVSAASEQIADSSARAQAFMDEGSRHFDKKEWALAREYFLKAWELLQHHTIAANLAEVEIKLGLYREAAEHLSFVLAQAPSNKSEDLAVAKTQLDECKQHVAVIELTVNEPGATVRVNGKAVGLSPLETEVFVDPGEVVATAELAGFEPASRTFRVDAGVHSSVSLVLRRRAPERDLSPSTFPKIAPRPQLTHEQDREPGNPARTWVLVSGGLLTAAAAGVGVVYALRFYSLGDEAEPLRDQSIREGDRTLAAQHRQCSPPPGVRPDVCSDLQKKVEDQYAAGTVAVVAATSAAILGGATLATYFLWKPGGAQQARVHISPQVGSGSGGVLVRGTF